MPNLFICLTPLQALIAQSLISQSQQSADLLMVCYPEAHNAKFQHYYQQTAAHCRRSVYYIVPQRSWQRAFRLPHLLNGLDTHYHTLYAASIDNPNVQYPASHLTFDRLETFDDGTGNLSPQSILYHSRLSLKRRLLNRLQGIRHTVLPPLHGGWNTRRKTAHFAAYNQVAAEFAELIGIDQWQINPYFEKVSGLNFHEREGEDALAAAVERVLAKIQAKYDEKGITDKPFVIVKADAGTYGMGVMSVKSADEVRGLNRKNRNKMAKVKEGLEVSEVIVQEGIYTYETLGGAVSEPVVYMMDRFVIGGFFRVHEGRGNDENLNAGGMVFVPLDESIPSAGSAADAATEEHCKRVFEQWDELGIPRPNPDCPDCAGNRLYVYGVMARLSLLAAAIELEQ